MSFNFLHNLWVYRLCIYLITDGIKIFTNILMGFKIWCQVGVGVTTFSKLPYSREFSHTWFQKLTNIRCNRCLWTIFCINICVLVGGFNFGLGTNNVPSESSAISLTTSAKCELLSPNLNHFPCQNHLMFYHFLIVLLEDRS